MVIVLECMYCSKCLLRVCVCVCVRERVCVGHTSLKCGPLSGHAPGAGPPALGHHDGELVQSVGLQPGYHVAQVGGVGSLQRRTHKRIRHLDRETVSQWLSMPLHIKRLQVQIPLVHCFESKRLLNEYIIYFRYFVTSLMFMTRQYTSRPLGSTRDSENQRLYTKAEPFSSRPSNDTKPLSFHTVALLQAQQMAPSLDSLGLDIK